jgi:hypothetical protein
MASKNETSKDEFSFEIVEHIGVISKSQTGWLKELNRVSWNGTQPKYDIREWDTKHEHMSRGITLFPDEAKTLGELLGNQSF